MCFQFDDEDIEDEVVTELEKKKKHFTKECEAPTFQQQ